MKITPACTVDKLHFDPEFFQDEVREGFYVSTMIKRYWAAQLVVLSEIAAICDRHGLKWFADCGSLIGAVRHEGFIPWDDDLDICMLRDDWEKFFEVAEKELPEGYKILTVRQEEKYEQIIGRVSNSVAIDIGAQHLEEFCGCPYTVGVDIFPLDGVYADEEKEADRIRRAKYLIDRYEKETKPSKRRELILEIERAYSECPVAEAEDVALMLFFVPRNTHRYPKDLFEHVARIPFENTYIYVPARYEEVLGIEYRNYMQVVKGWNFHVYPVYADQEETLRENIGRNPFRYTFDINELLLSIKRYTLKLINPPEQKDKEVVVFLPCRAKWWKTMESLWEKYAADETKEVHVLPIFYYDCDYNGTIGEKHDEREDFPEYVKVEECEKFDFEGIHPDKIVVQVPFDGWNSAMTVHEFFYSSNLQNFTDELIYVPCFDMDPPLKPDDKAALSIMPLIEQPVVVNADKVILKDEMMRQTYIDRLVQLSSEDTRQYWENKIVLMEAAEDNNAEVEQRGGKRCTRTSAELVPDEKNDNFVRDGSSEAKSDSYSDIADLNQWDALLQEHVGQKTIVYYVTINMIARHAQAAIDKIRRSLEIFEAAGDGICCIFEPQANLEGNIGELDEALQSEYQNIVAEVKSMKNVIYDCEGTALLHMDKWNAYYGEQGAIVHRCKALKIPIMIENIDI